MMQPLGAVIISGLTLSTTITLILIPVLYSLLHDFRKKLRGQSDIEVIDV
jgi:Cu/Ag efflux pump CusA